MRSQTQTVEKAYSQSEIKQLKELFSELRTASKNKRVQEYVQRVKAELKD